MIQNERSVTSYYSSTRLALGLLQKLEGHSRLCQATSVAFPFLPPSGVSVDSGTISIHLGVQTKQYSWCFQSCGSNPCVQTTQMQKTTHRKHRPFFRGSLSWMTKRVHMSSNIWPQQIPTRSKHVAFFCPPTHVLTAISPVY